MLRQLLQRPCHIINQTHLAFQRNSWIGGMSNYHCSLTRFRDEQHSLGVKSDDGLLRRNHRSAPSLHPLLHTGAGLRQRIDILSIVQDARANLGSVQMTEMKKAPLPVFWCGVAGLVPYVAPVIVQMFTGYMPALGSAQLMYSGTILSFLGGLKFGSMLHCDSSDCTWRNIGLAMVPAIWAWGALLLPTGYAMLTVGAGLMASLGIDLATSKYPPWFVSLKTFLTLTATLFILLCLKQYLFNRRYYHGTATAEKVK